MIIIDYYSAVYWRTADNAICDILSYYKGYAVLVFFSSPLYHILWPSSVDVSPSPVHLVSARPTISHLCRDNAWVSSLAFPVACKVRTFHVPMVVSFPAIFNCFLPAVDFSLPSRGPVGSAVVVIPGLDLSDVISVFLICAFQWVCRLGATHLLSWSARAPSA